METDRPPYDVVIQGEYAYLPYETWREGSGFYIVDISDPTTPALIGVFEEAEDSGRGITVDDDYAFLAQGNEGVVVVGIADPTRPERIASIDTTGYAYDVNVLDEVVLVADGGSGLQIVDSCFRSEE